MLLCFTGSTMMAAQQYPVQSGLQNMHLTSPVNQPQDQRMAPPAYSSLGPAQSVPVHNYETSKSAPTVLEPVENKC